MLLRTLSPVGYNRSTFMAISIGQQLGSYEITALLGKGGMGEVYRARDIKLKREVAIKFLPDEFSRDVDRINRFQREAEVLASLNHPNIAAIYDLQQANEMRFLVLELIEGETLAARVANAPIPLEETLDIAKQICEALEAAHDRGIIHRDLKPANVKITPDGKVKVLRLRIGQGYGRRARECHDVELAYHAERNNRRDDRWNRRLHVSGASEGSCSRPTQRCICVWKCAVRNAHRPSGVPRRGRI